MVARRRPSGSRMVTAPPSTTVPRGTSGVLSRRFSPDRPCGRLRTMRVDVSCKKCGQRRRLELGDPGDTPVDEFIHRVKERLAHHPSFECFGGHLELAPPLPRIWEMRNAFDTVFRWEYEEGRTALMNLYEKGKKLQWNANVRIDWSQDLDPENPQELPDESISIFGSPMWERLTRQEKATLRRHLQAWQLSQFLHGEQGALVCTAKIVQQVPSVDAKFYAATQVMDEARHVETYSRLLHEKFELAYPITPTLKRLLDDVLSDARWDMTYLGMQVLIEGLALAAFATIRDQAKNSLAAAVNAYVMQDEARHVAFGRLTLRDYYPQLTQAERDEREEFAVEACYLMRDRFLS